MTLGFLKCYCMPGPTGSMLVMVNLLGTVGPRMPKMLKYDSASMSSPPPMSQRETILYTTSL